MMPGSRSEFLEDSVCLDGPAHSGGELEPALYSRAERLCADAVNLQVDVLLATVRFAETVETLGLTESAERAYKRAANAYLRVLDLLAQGPFQANRVPVLNTKLDYLRSLLPKVASEVPLTEERQPKQAAPEERSDGLTAREIQVLKLIAEGNSSKQLAFELGISFKTAVCHRYNIMEKLNIHDVSGLVRYAIRTGISRP